MAWCNSIEELEIILQKYKNHKIFLDLPIKRIKPPNNRYSLDDMLPIFSKYDQIKYFAISNIESENDLDEYVKNLPDNVIIVPKIESPQAVKNIESIIKKLKSDEKILMLDHDDLFSNLLKNNEPSEAFQNYLKDLNTYCTSNNIILLRTIGVIFSDDEKRFTQYVN